MPVTKQASLAMTTISAGTAPPTVPALSEAVCLRHDDDLNLQHSAGVVESVGGEIELSRLIASVAMVGSVCERKDQCQTADAIFNSSCSATCFTGFAVEACWYSWL